MTLQGQPAAGCEAALPGAAAAANAAGAATASSGAAGTASEPVAVTAAGLLLQGRFDECSRLLEAAVAAPAAGSSEGAGGRRGEGMNGNCAGTAAAIALASPAALGTVLSQQREGGGYKVGGQCAAGIGLPGWS